MLLVIDIGNTTTHIGLFRNHDLVYTRRNETDKKADYKDIYSDLEDKLKSEGETLSEVKNMVISSVVPHLDSSYIKLCKKYLNLSPFFIDEKNAGIEIKIKNKREVGADRLVNSVAAVDEYRPPILIIDFGTATTFDFIDETGAFAGGLIVPGINVSKEALLNATSKLHDIDIAKTEYIIGKDTSQAMKAGLYHGYLGLIKHIVDKIRSETQTDPELISTGGLSPLFAPELDMKVEKDLTLKGLKKIFERNIKKKTR